MTDPGSDDPTDAIDDENAQSGTFVVTHADDASAVVRDVETAQVLTLSSNPGLAERDVLEATVAPEPPIEATWRVIDVEDRRTIDLVDSGLSPTRRSIETAADLETGEVSRTERAGTGEIHVLSISPAEVETAAAEVLEDLETIARAARLEAVRVEIRRAPDEGVLSVRYLPD